MPCKTTLRVALPLMAAMAFSAPAFGQAAAGNPAAEGAPTALQGERGASFSDDQLKSFADAVRDVNDVTREYAAQMQSSGTGGDAADVQREAEKEMIQAIEDNDLSVQQYNQIATAAQNDPHVAQTIRQHLTEDR
ncbi:MAG: DUF4168 domain-containing protein [Caenispirillum bisanense]|nr:DUF4168 domain-containing protein [Caenispirillum bisanense]MCA1971508.1 DUF4168 domain-containing protein [Caenispirillum sp.]